MEDNEKLGETSMIEKDNDLVAPLELPYDSDGEDWESPGMKEAADREVLRMQMVAQGLIPDLGASSVCGVYERRPVGFLAPGWVAPQVADVPEEKP